MRLQVPRSASIAACAARVLWDRVLWNSWLQSSLVLMVARECNVPSLQRNARSAPEGFLLAQSFRRDTLNVLNRGIFSIQVPAIGGAAQARGGTITLSGRSDSR